MSADSATYRWHSGSIEDFHKTNFSKDGGIYGYYWVTANNKCGNDSTGINIGKLDSVAIQLPTDTIICNQDTLLLNVENPRGKYQWRGGETSSVITVSDSTNYQVTVTNPCNTTQADIKVDFQNTPTIDLGPNKLLCEGKSITLEAKTEHKQGGMMAVKRRQEYFQKAKKCG